MSETLKSKIVMAGPTGVGKTSLLSAMYPLLEKHFPSGDYKLVPEQNTRNALDKLRNDLAKLGEGGIKVKDKIIIGTLQAQEFNFDLQYTGENNPVTDIALQVWDIPGAYCTQNNGIQAQTYLNDSDISFWCIDAVALMESGGKRNDIINNPLMMADCIRNSKLNAGHTVCLVLMRSETYEHNNKTKQLFDKCREKFGDAVAVLRRNPNIGKVYLCSIQTTGNLRFSYYKAESPVFIRSQAKDGYCPQHCELPVLVAVKRSLESAVQRARKDIQKIVDEYFPFTRWLWFLPGHFEYKRKKGVAERLSQRLVSVMKSIDQRLNEEEKNKRLFEW